jgi:hypothetical protein
MPWMQSKVLAGIAEEKATRAAEVKSPAARTADKYIRPREVRATPAAVSRRAKDRRKSDTRR